MKQKAFFSFLFCFFSFAFPQASRRIVNSIEAASYRAGYVTISWKLPQGATGESLVLFKDTKPFSSGISLENAKPICVMQPAATSYTDKVLDFKEYYYAVLFQGDDVIIPCLNATATGARSISLPQKEDMSSKALETQKLYQQGEMRGLPLPLIQSTLRTKRSSISATAKSSAKSLATVKMKQKPLSLYAFDCDLISPEGGDDYLLFETLRKHFAKKQFSSAIQDLEDFLSVSRKISVADRAVFYLGECKYFCSDFKGAIFCFLKTQDVFPSLSKKWLTSSLDHITLQDQE